MLGEMVMHNTLTLCAQEVEKTRLVPSGTFPPAAVTITRQLPKKKDEKKKMKKKKKKKNPMGADPPPKKKKKNLMWGHPTPGRS